MSHLSEERLLYLGLEPEQPTQNERDHLATCRACSEALASERALTASLQEMPKARAPASFVQRTTERFVAAHKARAAGGVVRTLILATLLGVVAALGMTWVAIFNIGPIAHEGALFVEKVAVLLHAVATVLSSVPLAPLALTASMCAAALCISSLLGRLAMSTAEAK